MINDDQENCGFAQEEFTYKQTFSKRKQWDKTNPIVELNFNDSNRNFLSNKRYEEHLKKLQQNNRISKMAHKKDPKSEKLKRLEAGFCVYINGHHRKKERYALRHTNLKSKYHNKNQECDNQTIGCSSKRIRKQWANSSFNIKTSDGYIIKINGPDTEFKYKSENVQDCESNDEQIFLNNLEEKDFSFNSPDSPKTDTEEKEKPNKRIMVELTPKDAKVLRRNMAIFDKENFRKCLNSELDNDDSKSNKNKLSENNLKDNDDISGDICDMILSKVVNLRDEDRISLINFLSQFEENTKKTNPE